MGERVARARVWVWDRVRPRSDDNYRWWWPFAFLLLFSVLSFGFSFVVVWGSGLAATAHWERFAQWLYWAATVLFLASAANLLFSGLYLVALAAMRVAVALRGVRRRDDHAQ